MKLWIKRFRKWLIIKLGGYVEPLAPVVRLDRIDVPIQKLCFMGTYQPGCSHENIRRMGARGLVDLLCNAGLVKYEYTSDPTIGLCHKIVKGTIRVVERREE